MKISLVIPVFNESLRIRDFLKRFENLSFKPELIIVDGGSTDGTREIVRGYENVKMIDEIGEFRCPANARNIGVEKAKGDIVIILDVDAFFEKDFFKKIITEFENNKEAKIIKFKRKPMRIKTNSNIQEAYYWRDASRWGKISDAYIFKKELLPKQDPSLGYGEDKIVSKKSYETISKVGFVDSKETISYFQLSPINLNEVWKRYEWYGRTGMFYYHKSKDNAHFIKMVLSILSLFIFPLLIIPMTRGFIYALKVLKEYPKGIVLIPLLEAIAFPAMAIGFFKYFLRKNEKHRGH